MNNIKIKMYVYICLWCRIDVGLLLKEDMFVIKVIWWFYENNVMCIFVIIKEKLKCK